MKKLVNKFTIKDQRTIKYNNMYLALNIIRKSQGISRSELARQTGMSTTSAMRIISDLIDMGLVADTGNFFNVEGVGRKAVIVDIIPNAFYVLGIGISETYLNVGVLDFSGRVIVSCKKNIDNIGNVPHSFSSVLDMLYDMAQELLKGKGLSMQHIVAIGVGIVGYVKPETGTLIYADLLKWSDIEVSLLVKEKFHVPAYVDNDIKCALEGELSVPSAHGIEDIVMLHFGRGVGSAVVNNGKLFRGALNYAGEIGHTTVDYSDGKLCACGKRGCLAAYMTEESIIEYARKNADWINSISDIMKAYNAKERWATIQIERICGYIAVALNNTVCMFNPQNIILGGSLIDEHPFIFDKAISKYHSTMHSYMQTATRFHKSVLKQDAVFVGAAHVAIRKHIALLLKEACHT